MQAKAGEIGCHGAPAFSRSGQFGHFLIRQKPTRFGVTPNSEGLLAAELLRGLDAG